MKVKYEMALVARFEGCSDWECVVSRRFSLESIDAEGSPEAILVSVVLNVEERHSPRGDGIALCELSDFQKKFATGFVAEIPADPKGKITIRFVGIVTSVTLIGEEPA